MKERLGHSLCLSPPLSMCSSFLSSFFAFQGRGSVPVVCRSPPGSSWKFPGRAWVFEGLQSRAPTDHPPFPCSCHVHSLSGLLSWSGLHHFTCLPERPSYHWRWGAQHGARGEKCGCSHTGHTGHCVQFLSLGSSLLPSRWPVLTWGRCSIPLLEASSQQRIEVQKGVGV